MNEYIVRASLPNRLHTFTRDRMARAWDTLEAEGKTRFLFYDGEVRDRIDFIQYMTDPEVCAYAVYDQTDKDLLAVYWLNEFSGRCARMHYAYPDAGIPERYRIGILTCRFLILGGVSALIGITPRPFRHAWRFALAVGFQQARIVPDYCTLTIHGTRRIVDGVATVCDRTTLLPEP